MAVEFREMGIDEYEQVIALWKSCEGIGLSSADSRPAIASYLERNPGLSCCAWETAYPAPPRLVGAVLCGHDGRRGYIHHLAVDSTCRKQGIGSTLVERCLAALGQAGISRCHIFVFNNNPEGIAFWEGCGWFSRPDLRLMSINVQPG
jgi:putative acetyltransferase